MSTSIGLSGARPKHEPSVRRGAVQAVFVGGTSAAILDIGYAFAVWSLAGVTPLVVLRAIASGVLGGAAFRGGLATAVLGGALHWLIAMAMAAAYVIAGARLPTLVHRPLVWGPLYGLALYFVMDRVVVPLSAAPSGAEPSLPMTLGQVAAHALLVGLPIALAASRFGGRPRKA